MSVDETETRTLEDVSFEAFCTAKVALGEKADGSDDSGEAERAEDARAELVAKWNEANDRERGDDDV